jgi:hypothetical protein
MAKASKSDAKELAKLSSDCSFLLTHLIRLNAGPGIKQENPRVSLQKILKPGNRSAPRLLAGKHGWYATCMTPPDYFTVSTKKWMKSSPKNVVCFTESTLAGLKAHRHVFNARYGVAFDREYLFNRGANPCLNIRSELLKEEITVNGADRVKHLYNFIPEPLHPYINVINEAFDATHEREWRFVGDLTFNLSDLLFIFCPEADFHLFAHLQKNGKPVLFDLDWLDRV